MAFVADTELAKDESRDVTVIVAAHNAAATLDRALTALGAQRFDKQYEVIVVDDGSTDQTAEIARRHAPLVKLICNPTCRGAGAARNCGVETSGAPLLAFTDAD